MKKTTFACIKESKRMKNKTLIYDFGVSHEKKIRFIRLWFLRILSPTWWYADHVKKGSNPESRMRGIIARNYSYLFISMLSTLIFGGLFSYGVFHYVPAWLTYSIFLFIYSLPFSRCNEIFLAFIADALDKSEGKVSSSLLSYRERIELALKSYIELILNYSLIYLLIPKEWFNKSFESVLDTIYFSGVTITTLGYGDYSPTHWLPKILIIHEVLVGFTLIIVSFALYVGKAPTEPNL
ncbi:potassium channel family protein [Aeromonas lusitana]|uniref:Potassium channel domain-containing protein n=1 Tax=Aeromonas lusitana TaxID=931529 RepID=A0A2M8H9W5_9GAMM|nr:potassium channel family protein [Aeromonas lusitana]PJC93372.1 hypothetical protein CUC44_09030 [Aeromonas lusitana]